MLPLPLYSQSTTVQYQHFMWFIELHHLGYQHIWSRGRTGVKNMSKSQNLPTILKRPETSYGTLIQVLLAHQPKHPHYLQNHHHIQKHPHDQQKHPHYLKKMKLNIFTNILFANIVINITSIIIFPFFQSPSPFWAVWGGSQLARVLDFVFIDTEHTPLDRKV